MLHNIFLLEIPKHINNNRLNTDTDEFLTQLDGDDNQYKNQMIEFLKANQGNIVEEPKTKKQKKQDKQKNLEKFME